MNYYRHHIGDYDADTAHLSWVEDLAYTRLLRLYYRREKPIPADEKEACRLVRAMSRHEKIAVSKILREFFFLESDGWRQNRCDEEISAAGKKSQRNRAVGGLGGRPRKPIDNPDGFQKETQTVISGNPEITLANSQEPIANSQDPPLRSGSEDLSATSADSPQRESVDRCPHQEIIALYHEILPELPSVKVWNANRAALLRQRWKEDPGLPGWRKFFEYVKQSAFLTGRAKAVNGSPPFVADLEWLLKPNNQAKVIEGKYHRG